MKRQIIEINQDTCIGCGLCANACEQGAIQIIDGKAKLVSDSYCDGLGMCLPACPVDAIQLIEKETQEFDSARKGITKKKATPSPCGCPGTMAKSFKSVTTSDPQPAVKMESELRQWPVQLKLVSPMAEFWDGADVLVAADCTAYAYANFHSEFMKGKVTVIGCPKLDDNQLYLDKLTEIFSTRDIQSVTVVRMSVPCCGGIVQATKQALVNSQKEIPYSETIISPDGQIG